MLPVDQRQDLKNLLECSICLETFDDPRTLLCLHSFCKKCLENFVDGKREDELNCPVCRCKFTLNEEGKNTTLLETLLIYKCIIECSRYIGSYNSKCVLNWLTACIQSRVGGEGILYIDCDSLG